MKTKIFFKLQLATLVVGVLSGCQSVQPQSGQTPVTPVPVGQSTSTVMITNQTGLDNVAATQQKLMDPSDLSKADLDVLMKADAAKNPQLCDAITVDAYRKFCIQQAGDRNSQPLQAVTPTQEKCKSTTETNGVKNCINYEE